MAHEIEAGTTFEFWQPDRQAGRLTHIRMTWSPGITVPAQIEPVDWWRVDHEQGGAWEQTGWHSDREAPYRPMPGWFTDEASARAALLTYLQEDVESRRRDLARAERKLAAFTRREPIDPKAVQAVASGLRLAGCPHLISCTSVEQCADVGGPRW